MPDALLAFCLVIAGIAVSPFAGYWLARHANLRRVRWGLGVVSAVGLMVGLSPWSFWGFAIDAAFFGCLCCGYWVLVFHLRGDGTKRRKWLFALAGLPGFIGCLGVAIGSTIGVLVLLFTANDFLQTREVRVSPECVCRYSQHGGGIMNRDTAKVEVVYRQASFPLLERLIVEQQFHESEFNIDSVRCVAAGEGAVVIRATQLDRGVKEIRVPLRFW